MQNELLDLTAALNEQDRHLPSKTIFIKALAEKPKAEQKNMTSLAVSTFQICSFNFQNTGTE